MRLGASLAAVLLTTGCSTMYAIPRSELPRLDGWKDDRSVRLTELGDMRPGEAKETRSLRDVAGTEHTFSADTPLVLVRRDGATVEERFVQVHVDATRFVGVPLSRPEQPVEVPMEQVQAASVRHFNLARTLLVSGGVAAGVLASVATLAVLLAPKGHGGNGTTGENLPCTHACHQ
ncbi:hypothetical protein KRR26_14960 [Corallococcus sp. M34]|uniref:hypothetical protein n=1 Tax=Citreicoccus inhibens TaxID=2849499 RepID=UPI001C21D731|nr:hypothetical protein [Citreicoccus inhibens]MBU8896917.1 hypothetical protein [Citreicoccus inhibens]